MVCKLRWGVRTVLWDADFPVCPDRGRGLLDHGQGDRGLVIRPLPVHSPEPLFSLQAAYAAPLILLAQTRHAERDKVNAIADAERREYLSELALQRQAGLASETEVLARLLSENTALSECVRVLAVQVEGMTADIHRVVLSLPATEFLGDIWSGATTS